MQLKPAKSPDLVLDLFELVYTQFRAYDRVYTFVTAVSVIDLSLEAVRKVVYFEADTRNSREYNGTVFDSQKPLVLCRTGLFLPATWPDPTSVNLGLQLLIEAKDRGQIKEMIVERTQQLAGGENVWRNLCWTRLKEFLEPAKEIWSTFSNVNYLMRVPPGYYEAPHMSVRTVMNWAMPPHQRFPLFSLVDEDRLDQVVLEITGIADLNLYETTVGAEGDMSSIVLISENVSVSLNPYKFKNPRRAGRSVNMLDGYAYWRGGSQRDCGRVSTVLVLNNENSTYTEEMPAWIDRLASDCTDAMVPVYSIKRKEATFS